MKKYIALFIVAVLILTACGKGDSDNSKSRQDGAVITLQMRESASFNPLSVTNHSLRDAYGLCYEPLFSVDNAIKPVGVLAEGIDVSDDCMTAVIRLKNSVLWHDGMSFTSSDVVHTINLLKEHSGWGYYDCVKYIDTATVIDAYSLRINMTIPYGQIAYSLTFPIVPAHNMDLDSVILGTGPYKFSSYTPSTTLELARNEKWHGGQATCGKVNINVIKDSVAVTTAFNTGMLSAVTDESFDTENSSPKADCQIYSYPSADFEYMALNHRKAAFRSQNIRCAISYAIDRSAIVSECYNGNATEANTPVHPSAENIAESSILSQFSQANASEILFMEGYTMDENTKLLKDGANNTLTFSILVNEENLSRVKTAELIAKQLFAVGIDAEVIAIPFEEYLERISNGNFDAYIGGSRLGNFFDYDGFFSEGSALNNYGYSSREMQTALAALKSASGEGSLSDAVFNFEEVFLREQPILGLLFKNRTLITNENIAGDVSPVINAPYRNIQNWSIK